MRLLFMFIIILIGTVQMLNGQVVINEVLSLNTSNITDENDDYSDWIELYNSSNETVNLNGFSIKDNLIDTAGWVFPEINMAPNSHLLLFASGKDRKTYALNSKTVINEGDVWQYIVPPSSYTNGKWREPGYDASGWKTGKSGFGFGDNDDQTVINSLSSIYIRKVFTIEQISAVEEITLHVDFDDAFIAFINGKPVAMENVTLSNGNNFDEIEVTGQHEAVMWQGGTPLKYQIDLNSITLREGENVLALQGYNTSSTSSDFSLIPFLTIGATNYAYTDVASFIQIQEGSLHTNFKIKNEGEGIFLLNAQGKMIDSVWVVALPANVSYGRTSDGSAGWSYFPLPTPGETNSNPTDQLRNDSLQFSHSAGFYNQPLQVQLSTKAKEVSIRYTTNGSEPIANSTLYTKPINISNTSVIRAASFYAGIKTSETFTQSYFINSSHTLPVFSITTDSLNLWDYNNGIYVKGPNAESDNPNFGANFWQDWEKPVHVEYFDEQKVQHLNQGAGVKIFGAWSRANAQKSLALFARASYGKGSFSYKMFNDRDIDKYESFILRNSGNDWSYSMLRDGYVSEIAKSLDVERLAFQPAVVYLNGAYWGIHNLREKPNEHYFESHYGVKENDLNFLEMNNQIINGTNTGYAALISYLNKNSLSNEAYYNYIKELVDINCFIDYELIQIYINNTDWPGNNIKYWNSSDLHHKWRWLLFDTDFGFNIWGGSAYTENGLVHATAENSTHYSNSPWATLVLRKMLANPDFRNQFINRMADLMNTTLLASTMNAKLDSITNIVRPEIAKHRAFWGHNSNWESYLNVIANFNNVRQRYVRDDFAEYFNTSYLTLTLTVSGSDEGEIKVNTIVPAAYPFTGTYFSKIPITFTALPKLGYKFVRWEKASNSTQPSITLTLNGPSTLRAVFEPVRGDETVHLIINEIKYSSIDDYDSGDWIELYNNGTQTVDLSGLVLSDADISKSFVFPDGMMMYPNSYLVICENKAKFNMIYPKVTNSIGDLTFGLSSSGDVVYLYDRNYTIIDQVLYEAKQPWPVEPVETAATLELKNPTFDNNQYSSWQAGQLGGTPGMQNGMYTSVDLVALNGDNASCFPTRFSDYTTLRFNSNNSSGYAIRIFDVQGRLSETISGKFDGEGTYYLDIFTEQAKYQQGIYLVKVQTGSTIETLKVIKL